MTTSSRPYPNASRIIAAGCALATSMSVVSFVQGDIAKAHHTLVETSDVYVLPPPKTVALLSLGYRAALADVLWAQVLISQGLHTQAKRRFENLSLLLDTINELDPTYRTPYLMAPALMTFQTAERVPVEEVYKAREILERGAKNRPYDADVQLALGEFVAYIAPAGYLKSREESARWKKEGALYLARAAELGAHDSAITWRALGAASILDKAGERQASIRHLRRWYAITDDEELKNTIRGKLAKLTEEDQESLEDALKRAEQEDLPLPFVSRSMWLTLGPPRDAAYCSGRAHANEQRCSSTWDEWLEHLR